MRVPESFSHKIPWMVSLLLILLFAYAGSTKLLEGNMFYDNIRNSPIFVGETIAAVVAIIIPVSEIVTSFLIAWPRTRLIGLYGALVLMLLFTGYIVTILFFTTTVPCSCGGIISLLSWSQHLILVLVFLFLIILSIICSKPIKKNQIKMNKEILLRYKSRGKTENLNKRVGNLY